jgi:hypothetical protein
MCRNKTMTKRIFRGLASTCARAPNKPVINEPRSHPAARARIHDLANVMRFGMVNQRFAINASL